MTASSSSCWSSPGIGAGLVGSIAGLASLISYPALLATGLPPVTANVTNTVALVLNSVGSVSASRPELRGQGRRLLRLGVAGVLGGAVGAALLLLTPSAAFERVVPLLIAGASVAMLVQRPPRDWPPSAPPTSPHRPRPGWLPLGVFASAIYGGYFGAAAGVLMLAMFLLATGEALPRSNALKNVVLGVANGVAAVGFIVVRLDRLVGGAAAGDRAASSADGSGPGSCAGRRRPLLRRVIAVAGLGLAIKLGIQAYG